MKRIKRNLWLALWLAITVGAALSVPIFIASQSELGK
jgi:hypothetical protein